MPPSLTEWLPEDHLVWTVLGAVDAMDLDRFNEAYRLGGAGRAAYDPAMIGLSSTGRRNAVWLVTLRVGSDDGACLGDAAVVVEARPEGGPERRQPRATVGHPWEPAMPRSSGCQARWMLQAVVRQRRSSAR